MSLFGDYDELSEEFLFGPREPPHARWQNNTFEKDLSQFNVVQWMEHFWNDDDDHEFNDDEIPNKYQNVCGKVKSWIREDLVQAAMNQVELNDPTPTDLVLLLTLIRSHLNLDLIFYMIEFIPTWSKWKKFKAEAIHQRIIQLPSGIVKRHAKFESYWDLPFVTFHKMRLLRALT
ncbi:hypothetical protein C9374_001754 [Naegleria lovaniensis]|uniref:Uncharacterized protein n=1 Tax=Naegleria lovaniensis TaxID=51637 RepID=A0AA88GUU3_NAELO|nr:uncharacterized protein C9374_001754 [Naegleria lovaniensis]KAG2387422.1 hypothetical protein C9374_001754 [Naegleria lovaniensis]